MEGLMSMIEGSSKSNEIRTVEEIDHSIMQEFLDRLAIWNFHEMSRDEFTSKSELEKKLLIIKYYNTLLSGIGLLFVVGVSFCFMSAISDSGFRFEIFSSIINVSP